MPVNEDAGTRNMVAPLDLEKVIEELELGYKKLINTTDIDFGYSMQPQ